MVLVLFGKRVEFVLLVAEKDLRSFPFPTVRLRALVGRPVPEELHAALLLRLLYAESFAEFMDAFTLGLLLMFPIIQLRCLQLFVRQIYSC